MTPPPIKGLAFLLSLAALCACGATPVAPISDRAVPVRQPESEYRTVMRGDTLYSIAWESGRDYKDLAAWNGISPPYTIKLGQQLRLYPPASAKTSADKPPASKPEGKGSSTTASKPKPSEKMPEPSKGAAGQAPAREVGPWVWPAKGKILAKFSEGGNSKGIDIGGNRGQEISAAADGRVVYNGSGLRGYGQLIIIKHNDDFLSAYAHNDRIHVKEGDLVKRGQKIAEMGNTGTDNVKLHFEIRRQGVPVDPMRYLPK